MNKFILLSIPILLILHSGCVSDDQPIQEIENIEYFRPSGKLAFSYSHRGNGEYLSVAEHLYDSKGRRSKTIMISEPLEIERITHYVYNELDSLHWEETYNVVENNPEFAYGYERIFDALNRFIERRIHRSDGTQRLVYKNIYDESGRMVERNLDTEREVFTYFDDGRIATIRLQYNNSDLSIGQLFRYDTKDLLVAKEYFITRGDSIPESGEGNIEEFDYDDKNYLIEKRFYDPNFGFGLQGRITFEYY